MSCEESAFWFLLGFDPFDPADWPAMSVAARDLEISVKLEKIND